MSTVNTDAARAELQRTDTPLQDAKRQLAAMRNQFELVLPPSIPADRLIRVLQTVVTLNPKLADPAVRSELMGAAMTVAQLGLDPTPAIGHAYIYPMKGKPTFVLGYKGAVWLANDNGVHLKSWAIHENDPYKVTLGTNAQIIHELPPFGNDRGRAIAYYCVARFADGTEMFDVMSAQEIETIRENSPGKNLIPWSSFYDEMAKKTVLKRLAKSIPLGVKAAEAFAHDTTVRTDTSASAIENTPTMDVIDAEAIDVDPATGETVAGGYQFPDAAE